MTAQEIIEKIKVEVNRLKPRIRKICGEEVKIPVEKVREKFDTLLSVLSDLEKEEKPIEHKDIDAEIGHWMDRLDDKYCILVNHYSIQDIKDTARHFAQWQKEQMLKEAVEGEYDLYPAAIYLEIPVQGIKHGDKVRIIVVKEEGKHV